MKFSPEQTARYNAIVSIFGKELRGVDKCVHMLAGITCPVDHKFGCDIAKFDHYRIFEHALISQPYAINMDNFDKLYTICKQLNLQIYITSKLSYHYIGHTFLIAVYNPLNINRQPY